LLGIISVRGVIIPVIDLRLRLSLAARPLARHARILVCMHGAQRFGLLVDAVGGVVRFAEAEIEPPPPSLSAQESSYLAGIGRQREPRDDGAAEEKIVIVLNLPAVVGFDIRWRRRHEGDDAEGRR
jgi:chemotaxis signal transduction protein